MRNNALYFPYINVPRSAWFNRVLLYWDQVSSIVPLEFIHHPERLDPYMRDLVASGLVNQIIPMHYLHEIPNFEEPFIEFIKKRIDKKRFQGFSVKVPARAKIHIEKMGHLAAELEQMGVASSERYPWYEVDPWVAKAFMAYLASTLGLLPEVSAAPVTSDSSSFSVLGGNAKFGIPDQVDILDKIRFVVLENLFPYPAKQTSIDQLLRFKEDHQKALLRLRNYIEQQCIEIANISDKIQFKERLGLFLQQVELETGSLLDAMKTKWADVAFATFAPLLGAGAALYTSDPFTNVVAGTGAALSLSASIYQAFKGHNNIQSIAQNPLAYAVYYRRLETK